MASLRYHAGRMVLYEKKPEEWRVKIKSKTGKVDLALSAKELEPAIILHADKTVDIEYVVKVMDIAYRNQYKIVLATKPN